MCSSPQPAMMCSPDSSIEHCTSGSDLDRSLGCLAATATRTTGETEYFMVTIGCESIASASASVPDLTMYLSMPTMPHVLPAEQASTASVLRPIIRMVRCTFFTYRSSFLPCE